MPIYEYQCQACRHKFEIIQKVSEPLLSECPACHKKKLRKLVSAASFQLKGTGWYVTDFKDKNKPAKAKEAASSGDGEKATTGEGAKKDTPAGTGKAKAAGAKKAAAD